VESNFNFIKAGWIILFIGMLFNFGAICLTYYALSIGYHEANGIMAIFYKIGYGAPLIICCMVWILMTLWQKRVIKKYEKIQNKRWYHNLPLLFIPLIIFILCGLDFWHDVFFLFLNMNIFTWLESLLIWNQWLGPIN